MRAWLCELAIVQGLKTLRINKAIPFGRELINDSTGTAGTLVDSADHDIGDTITYTLKATLGSDITDYDTYKLVFHDTMSIGLTFGSVTSITVDGGSDVKDKFDIKTDVAYTTDDDTAHTAIAGGTVLTVSSDNVLASDIGAHENSIILVTYTATLNDKAIIGSQGNPNKLYIEYSNNPDSTGTDKGPEDVNIVFTYDIEVDKVTGTAKDKLTGAAFALYKLYTDATIGSKTAVTSIKYDNGTKDYTIGSDKWVLVEQKTAGTNSEFTFSGVDDGTYLLVETTTPAGYNSIEPSKFTVTATHADGDTPSFTSITGEQITGDELAPITLGTKTKTEGSSTVTTGLKTEIVNQSGTVLPSTGGIGTTMFYVGGGLLALIAVVLLVTKRRVGSAE